MRPRASYSAVSHKLTFLHWLQETTNLWGTSHNISLHIIRKVYSPKPQNPNTTINKSLFGPFQGSGSDSPFSSANCLASSYVTSLWASRSALFPMSMITCEHRDKTERMKRIISQTERSAGERVRRKRHRKFIIRAVVKRRRRPLPLATEA